MLLSTRNHFVKSLALGVLLALCLHYLAEFSWKQTVALVLLAELLYSSSNAIWRAIWLAGNPTQFVVFIRPKWREILFDHGLVRDEQEWQQWLERIKSASFSEQSLLRDGFHFTVLQQARDLQSQFVFNNDGGSFAKAPGAMKPIPGIRMEQPNPNLPPGPSLAWIDFVWIPSFIANNQTWGGYKLSLVTSGRETKLAFLPVLEFKRHEIVPWVDTRAWKKYEQTTRKALEENGWKRTETEFWRSPSTVEHKYFSVTHGSI